MADYPDFEGQKSGLYSRPEWAAYEAEDKNFWSAGSDVAVAGDVTEDYTVPAGKTLYITHLSCFCSGYAAADRDNNQMVKAAIYNWSTGNILFEFGGNGGGSVALNKPVSFSAGTIARFRAQNFANHAVFLSVVAGGYEI